MPAIKRTVACLANSPDMYRKKIRSEQKHSGRKILMNISVLGEYGEGHKLEPIMASFYGKNFFILILFPNQDGIDKKN